VGPAPLAHAHVHVEVVAPQLPSSWQVRDAVPEKPTLQVPVAWAPESADGKAALPDEPAGHCSSVSTSLGSVKVATPWQ
jgi:hypothetical protein